MSALASLAAYRQRRAWTRAVRRLHALGTPALVPACVAAELDRAGVPWDWYHRAPCGQHAGECLVAVPDDAETGAEIHVPVHPDQSQ